MLSHVFLGMSLIGAEWVLYFLVLLSIVSVALIFERVRFYRVASRGLSVFRASIRKAVADQKWEDALKMAHDQLAAARERGALDLESEMTTALLSRSGGNGAALEELAQDAVLRARLGWDRNLSILATVASNAPFIGLFGTVLGIIKAFHDLSQQAGAAAQTVTAGISEALVATAVGLLVAIPAAVAFNLFQRQVKAAITEAEALKSFLVGQMGNKRGA